MSAPFPDRARAWREGARPVAPPQEDRVAFGALLAFTVILILAPQLYFEALAPLRIALVTAAVAGGAYLVPRLLSGRPLSIAAPEITLAAALFLWAALTIPFSSWPGGSVDVLVGMFFKSLAIGFLLCNTVTTTARLRKVLLVLALVGLPLAITAITQFATGSYLKGTSRIRGYEAPLTSNPNDLALTLSVILALTVALAVSPRPPLPRLAIGGMACLSAVGIVLTFSRGGFLVLATVLFLWMRRLRGRAFLEVGLAAAAALLAILPLLPSGYLGHLGTITNTEEDATGSAGERVSDMVAAARYTVTHPVLGSGIGMSTLALNEVRGTTWRKVHNVYLEISVELGVLGLILFVLLMRSAFRSAREARRLARETPGRGELASLADGINVGLAGFAVGSFFHPVSYHLYFYYLAALAVAAQRIASRAAFEEVPA